MERTCKKKSELGNKINFVHDAITRQKLGKQTSQASFEKVFKPITTKLDDVIVSNLVNSQQRKRRLLKKGEFPNYAITAEDEDEVPDMNLSDLFDEETFRMKKHWKIYRKNPLGMTKMKLPIMEWKRNMKKKNKKKKKKKKTLIEC